MVSVIIVAFNSGEFIASCLQALPGAAGDEPIQVMVIDNASSEDVTYAVRRSGVEAEVLRLDANSGYCGGNNVGIQHIMRKHARADAVLILNPDVVLPPWSIKKLHSVLTTTGCGGVSPWVTHIDKEPPMLRPRSLWGFPQETHSTSTGLVSVDRLPGCCMLVRTEVFERVGVFDEAYFLYWEEIDFCVRARRAGYQLLIDSGTKIQHGDGEGELRRHRVYYMWRNQVHFAFKNYGTLLGVIFLLRRVCVGNVKNAFTYVAQRRPALILSGLAGLWAGIRGETGRATSRHAVPTT
jgi:GT2 family glycosyltransferase